jgi:hypothetical protein
MKKLWIKSRREEKEGHFVQISEIALNILFNFYLFAMKMVFIFS